MHDDACAPLYRPEVQFAQAAVGEAEYLPLSHASHFTPADNTTVPFATLTTEPALHSTQSEGDDEPPRPTKRPTPHAMHVVALPAPTVTLYRPAEQSRHRAVDCTEYFPASHNVHVLAPAFDSVSVTDPALHSVQFSVGTAEYRPATQRTHFDCSVFGTLPDSHCSHTTA